MDKNMDAAVQSDIRRCSHVNRNNRSFRREVLQKQKNQEKNFGNKKNKQGTNCKLRKIFLNRIYNF